ncbi:mitochondrial assembly of ribosomal large subunit protein 1-like [Amphibalanus amphitrite]|uniref:mitochondrial assembly of ribosomal large subunit protein 1-like n=1 Tax=Amphibalanus amphitrite TaxID=1232801 RepID=UPI001C925F0F|nr:mitochondrial assembly of ribosomal large subunit protein 1-like [Amphibalanus amphitrite]
MWCRHLSRLSGRVPRVVCARWLRRSAALPADEDGDRRRMPRSVASRYRDLRQRPRVILDVHEEEQLAERGAAPAEEQALWDPLDAWSAERGRSGVFDVEELVEVLREEGMEDLCVLRLPEDHAYVGHMVLATARSHQHMLATAQFVKKLYKRKRLSSDPVPRIEGRTSKEWIAMDMVNIALHLFDRRAREHYDVDGLWAVGPRYDEKSQQEEEDNLLDLNPLAEFTPNTPLLERDLNGK